MKAKYLHIVLTSSDSQSESLPVDIVGVLEKDMNTLLVGSNEVAVKVDSLSAGYLLNIYHIY